MIPERNLEGVWNDGATFHPLCLTRDEWAAEAARWLVHAVAHIGWVREETGGSRGQLAVLLKPRGLASGLHGRD